MDQREIYFMSCQIYVRTVEAAKLLAVRNHHGIDVRWKGGGGRNPLSVLIFSKNFCNAM